MPKETLFTFQSLRKHPHIMVKDQGLYAQEEIEPWKVLLSINKKDVLCFSNIPNQFKQLMTVLKGKKYSSQSTQIQRQLNFDTQLLMLYLIHVKNSNKNDEFLSEWFKRPLTACYYFSRQVIQTSQNYDLLINYVAEHNHLTQLCKFLHHLLTQERLKILLASDYEVSVEQFKQQYQWSYHFVNNRSFGYTQQYTLIPTFDMINHSSTDSNVYQILSDQVEPERNELEEAVPADDSDDGSDNQEDEVPSGVLQKQKYLKNSLFYYHIYSTQKIRKGQEILIQYGQRNNQFLLQGYGFVQPNNKYDSLLIYLDLPNTKIHFDSVRGQGCPSFKLKTGRFNFQLFLIMKKYFYEEYYKISAAKSKILWSKPTDVMFQKYLFAKIRDLFHDNLPVIHTYDMKMLGSYELSVYEQERRKIIERQVDYYISVDQLLTDKQYFTSAEALCLPANLHEYATLLRALLAKVNS